MKSIEEQTREAADNYQQGGYIEKDHLNEEYWGFIAGAEWERNRDKWISVKDELPYNSGYYIAGCIGPYKEPGLVHFHPNTGWGNGFYVASHWMSLPELPKQKEDNYD